MLLYELPKAGSLELNAKVWILWGIGSGNTASKGAHIIP